MASTDAPRSRRSRERRRSRSPTDEAHVFKKPVQIVGRPPVTGHDISEDYLRNPPHNFDPSLAEAWTPESEEPSERQTRAAERERVNVMATEREEREEREEKEAKEAKEAKERTPGKGPGRVRRKDREKSKSSTPARGILPEEVQEGEYQKPSDRVLLPEDEPPHIVD